MPRYSVLEVENYSVYKHSFVGLKLSKNNEYKDEQDKKPDNDHAAEVKTNFTVSLKSPLYWQFLICFTILSFRIKSIQGILKSSDFFQEKFRLDIFLDWLDLFWSERWSEICFWRFRYLWLFDFSRPLSGCPTWYGFWDGWKMYRLKTKGGFIWPHYFILLCLHRLHK